MNLEELQARRDKLHQGYYAQAVGDMFSDFVLGYRVVGLHAQNARADLSTDAGVMIIRARQKPNGEWAYPLADTRPPHLPGPYRADRARDAGGASTPRRRPKTALPTNRFHLAATWLAKAKSSSNEDIGLANSSRAGTDKAAAQRALQHTRVVVQSDFTVSPHTLRHRQEPRGAHLGGLPVSDPVYQKGDPVLARHPRGQNGSGTPKRGRWPSNPTSMLHGYNQWVSAAATYRATMALTLALPGGEPLAATASPGVEGWLSDR